MHHTHTPFFLLVPLRGKLLLISVVHTHTLPTNAFWAATLFACTQVGGYLLGPRSFPRGYTTEELTSPHPNQQPLSSGTGVNCKSLPHP